MSDRTIWHLVADLNEPNPEPYCVLRVDISIRGEGSVEGTIVSLHRTRVEAEDRAHELDEEMQWSWLSSTRGGRDNG